MQKLTANDRETKSPDLAAANFAALRALFPEIVTEGPDGAAVNLDVLKQLVGDRTVTDAEEKYGLNWHGKRRARQLALTPSTGTLRPCPADSEDWDTTQNLMIEGDNLEVLKLLQKSYAGKVKLIYIDPPYNTGNDFIYPDNFQDKIKSYLQVTGQEQGGRRISSNSEASGRFHTDWLNMMYPRIKLARNLLGEDGAIFISIDDNEVDNLRKLCDDILGQENFIAMVIWQKVFSPKNTAAYFSEDHDYIAVYAKRKEVWEPRLLPRSEEAVARYTNPDNDPRGPWLSGAIQARNYYSKGQYEVTSPSGKTFSNPKGTYWRFSPERFKQLDEDKRIWWGEAGDGVPRLKRFISEVKDGVVPQTLWKWEDVGHTQEAKEELIKYVGFEHGENVLNSVKPTRLLRQVTRIGTSPDSEDIVLDFFAGSGTTGHAVIVQNAEDRGRRRFILVQLPEPLPVAEKGVSTIADLTTSRLRNVASSLRNAQQGQMELESKLLPDLGFRVFKLDSSNIKTWDPDHADLAASLETHAANLRVDRTEQDILFELLLKLGLDLTVPIVQRAIASKTVHSIGSGVLLVCLAESITQSEAEPVALGVVAWHKELAPMGESTVVFRDSAFADDVAKTNLAAILQQHGLKTVRSL